MNAYTNDTMMQIDNWADFAGRWIAERRRRGHAVNHNRLAVAMRKAGHAGSWATLLFLAALLLRLLDR